MASDKDQIIDYMLTQDGMPGRDPAFPNAPVGWSRAVAEAVAEAAGFTYFGIGRGATTGAESAIRR